MARRSNNETVAFWRDLIDEQAGSDVTVEQVCEWAGVSTTSFYAWKRRLRREPVRRLAKAATATGALVPVRLIGEPPQRGVAEIAIELPQGLVLRIPQGCDRPTVDVAVHAIRALTGNGGASC